MRIAIALVLIGCGGGGDSDIGASVVVDGVAVELVAVEAVQIDTFFDLVATADDGSALQISFPTATPVGPHTCDEGQALGLFTAAFTDGSGVKFASFYPIADPAFDCSFTLVETGDTIEIADLQGPLADMDGTDVRVLSAGQFRAPLTPD